MLRGHQKSCVLWYIKIFEKVGVYKVEVFSRCFKNFCRFEKVPPYWRDALLVGFFSILRVKGSSLGLAKLHRADFIDPLIHVKFRHNYMVQGDQSPEPFQKLCDKSDRCAIPCLCNRVHITRVIFIYAKLILLNSAH